MRKKILLFNTRTQKKEAFEPKDPKNVKLYTCGPTVYDFAHIGNLRTYVFEDVLKRTLLYFGYQVHHVMNLTDVDDKTIRGAIEKKISLSTFTKTFKQAFFKDLESLHILPAQNYPQATDHIEDMIKIIEDLLQKKIAYQGSDHSVYFSIKKFPEYGKLSHLKLDELQTQASNRLDDEYDKETLSDFVLWKSYDKKRDGSIYWDSPFGQGRPGWHLECSAMAMKYLGETLDLHMGGVDNIFPHHENEIAQSECFSCQTFCPMWVHVEHLVVEGKKMSKSLGNFFTLRDLLKKGSTGEEVRYLLLQTHYKTQLNFTLDGLKAASSALDRIQNLILRLQQVDIKKEQSPKVSSLIYASQSKFEDALLDDMNISVALSVIFDLARELHPMLDQNELSEKDAEALLSLLCSFDQVLGVLSFDTNEAPKELEEALIEREQARKEKNWARADELRDYILKKGYTIEDTPKGPTLKKSKS